ncbi:hypothetical protein GWK47_034018 [Chionoecetes opilio]|uniref:HAT C-terminal dimerisation domain-containing protein n=1 Tax=Chionoecetes opilio TaxID=41210 RepID=A0A8J4YV27_CHIOP|nr:hypothetical protein GWK47_034018 [Chionoecetes opilio]
MNRNPTTAANIKREVCRKLRTPNVTRWNSLYDSMEDLSEVDAVKSRLLFEVTEKAVLDTSEGSSPDEDKEDDFFRRGRENNLLEQSMFPARFRVTCVDVFVKYNTAIPSSAVVERLFSQGLDIMKAKRASLTSDNFEKLVFMKGNKDLPIWNCHQRTLNEEFEVKGLISYQ